MTKDNVTTTAIKETTHMVISKDKYYAMELHIDVLNARVAELEKFAIDTDHDREDMARQLDELGKTASYDREMMIFWRKQYEICQKIFWQQLSRLCDALQVEYATTSFEDVIELVAQIRKDE